MTNTINAEYVTEWADGTELRSTCTFDPTTSQVSEVAPVDIILDETLQLTREFVVLPDGTEASVAR